MRGHTRLCVLHVYSNCALVYSWKVVLSAVSQGAAVRGGRSPNGRCLGASLRGTVALGAYWRGSTSPGETDR